MRAARERFRSGTRCTSVRAMRKANLCGVFALLLAACGDPPPADQPDDAGNPSVALFTGLPVFPGARIVSGSASAAEARVSVAVSADSVARYYRHALVQRDWTIHGDARTPDGSFALHATSSTGRPVWILIQPVSPDSCEVSLFAAGPDPSAQ
jgi:hypothetical protein